MKRLWKRESEGEEKRKADVNDDEERPREHSGDSLSRRRLRGSFGGW